MSEQSPPADVTVYAVVFSNYAPPELESLWFDEADAEAEADRLNEADRSWMWDVRTMTVRRLAPLDASVTTETR